MSDVYTPPDFAAIRASLHVLAGQAVAPGVQIEIAKVAKVVTRLELKDDKTANADLGLIIGALQADTPNLMLARELRYAIKMRTGAFSNSWTTRFMQRTGGSLTAISLIGMVAATISWVLLTGLILVAFEVDYLGALMFFPLNELTTIMLAAYLGAVVSVMLNLRGTDGLEDISPGIVLVSSYLKPFIAVIVALFAYAAVKSGLITSTIVPQQGDLISLNGFHWVLGFCCGFSERFALRLVNSVTGRLGGSERRGAAK